MPCTTLSRINERIAHAAQRSGRTADAIQLVAVSKRMDAEKIQRVAACGQRLFGENYLQEAQQKITALPKNFSWHCIGHLQSNKASVAAALFDVIETVDRIKIAKALDRQAKKLEKELEVLIQVNIGRERQKHGVFPEETEKLLKQIKQETDLRVSGLMSIPPKATEPEDTRPYFHAVKKLSEQLAAKELFADNKAVQLSMGMSADFEIAIEEGATLVRVGTALFGQRETAVVG